MKKLSFFSLALCVMLSLLTSCGNNNGYKTTENGLQYKFHKNMGGDVIKVDQFVDADVEFVVNDTLTIAKYKYLKIMEPAYYNDIMEGLVMMHKGDSATFVVNIDSVFRYHFGAKPADAQLDSTATMKVNVSVNEIFNTQEEIEEHIQKEMEKEADDAKFAFNDYLVVNEIVAEPTASGLVYVCTTPGNGEKPETGKNVKVHYTGKLLDGTVFDSSVERGEPIEFPLGVGFVIPGWDEGIALMSKGEKGVLYIPYDLGYGERGAGSLIPPFSNLIFEVELVDFE